ncbi:2-amino-4-hydroxy-6-hydroxymethyldihydropteridine diphosphokinase [Acetobacter sp. TBRC 12305]|uniref:2-amino-4-hydroxy-6-hydroxymethyldihydropteridine pyrophosphokinase n=1 Tax=Acetobacter garciniae TaxID=2817435 RepID=A0A939HFY5_9PROT|nr:2-amino-4-hydroxy-6-hydroxymethyldihydropteridine diphosphokinase [Acetobacter garciniae]MBO1323660.1 2-amino-4-hydroxy-6-hydroxymethyldihydropteridine diphosphokinase [Acetobacter garciniae]MBX0343349.1 2-amino-4-hydroxy-6-hydroxymethyldihydropteridine diphosphokinase [Acetobacter garciniae]
MSDAPINTPLALIAIGANLPRDGRTALQTCQHAVDLLRAVPGVALKAVSHWYESAPQPPSGQPPYVNGMVLCATTLDPFALLDVLQHIETHNGRERSVPNAARTLDLDLVAYDAQCLDTDRLVLPHPRAHERAFVLRPLHDVMPDWVHPRSGAALAQMLAGVQGQQIRRIGE